MDRRVTSPTWGPPPPCKQALTSSSFFINLHRNLFFLKWYVALLDFAHFHLTQALKKNPDNRLKSNWETPNLILTMTVK